MGSVQRQADVDAMIQRYANGEGRGRDIAYLRRWAQDVRRRRGPNAIFTKVEITPFADYTRYTVWYRYPKDAKGSHLETGDTRMDNVTDVPTVSRTTAMSSRRPDNGLTALSRSSAAVPRSSARQRVPGGSPATQNGARAGRASTGAGEGGADVHTGRGRGSGRAG